MFGVSYTLMASFCDGLNQSEIKSVSLKGRRRGIFIDGTEVSMTVYPDRLQFAKLDESYYYYLVTDDESLCLSSIEEIAEKLKPYSW